MAVSGLRSISTRTALILGIVAAACFGGAVWVIQDKAASEQEAAALRELEQLAATEAGKVQSVTTETLATVRGLAIATLAHVEQGAPDRGAMSGMVADFVRADPVALGYWLEFERDGFDARDAEFARTWPADVAEADAVAAFMQTATQSQQVSTDSGRFSAYWVRDASGAPALEHAVGRENDTDLANEDYYVAVRERGGELMHEPYLDEVDGRNVLMTSLMVPIVRGGTIIGAAGADVTLDRIQAELAGVHPYGTGVLRLLSPRGMVLAAPESALLGKPWPDPVFAQVEKEAAAGRVVRDRVYDDAAGGEVFRIYVPVTFGRAPDAFVLALSAPVDAVMAGVVEVRNRVVMVGVVSVLLLAAVVFLILRRVVGLPLRSVVTAVDAVAAGRLDHPIAPGGDDEVGQVSRALRKMQSDLRERIEAERRIAAENLRVRIALDNAGTAMLIADADGVVAYANPAMRGLLAQHAGALRAALPSLDPHAIEGRPVAQLQPGGGNPQAATSVQQRELQFGRVVIAQTLAPVTSAQGERLGVVIEWRDRSQEVAVEAEVAAVIEAAAQGDLDHRIGTAGKSGFFLRLAQGVDGMLDANSASISDVQRVLAALADGDLTQRIEADYRGVFGRMRDDVNLTSERLSDILGRLREAVDQINTAAREIASGNEDLSARSEQQAASLEEAAASMEQLTSTVKNNAESSRQARELAHGAADVASRGGEVVRQVVDEMSGITAASRRIENIIGVIDGIAFQTNILALNAAVEAARAGEQGRGFAVVASEVRTLAQRSAEAAKEIKGLIGESVRRVDQGATLVGTAGRTMEEIVEAVRRVNDLMAEITAASEEQATGIDQVNQTITHMDSVTQQNVALVEEATAAAGSLEEQASGLQQIVAVFRV